MKCFRVTSDIHASMDPLNVKRSLSQLTIGRPALYPFFRRLERTCKGIGAFIFRVADIMTLPFSVLSGLLLKILRTNGLSNFPLAKRVLLGLGVFPIADHYYEPLFHPRHIRRSLRDDRPLPGVDMNVEE